VRILYLPNEYSQQRQREKKRKIYPVIMAMEAEFCRKQGHEVYWGRSDRNYNFIFDYGDHLVLPYDKVITEPEGLPFLSLPHPDRVFTQWWEFQDNGNFKYHPGTYIQAANGCWWGKCSFCVEQKNKWEVRPVYDVISEINECQALGFKEIFDDSGTFPIGRWLDEFCRKFNKSTGHNKLKIGCNMRLVDIDYDMLYHSNFRMLLFGLESANQSTLDKIRKGVKVEDVKYIIKAAKAGLEPHICVIFGIPGETDSDAIKTLKLVHYLLRKGYAKTAQASFYQVPGETGNETHRKFIKRIYEAAYSPQFWFNQIKDIKNIADLKYLWRKIKAGLSR